MSSYIDREAFKCKYLCCGYLPEMSVAEFEKFPSCDVQPVRHGLWITWSEMFPNRKLNCSVNWQCEGDSATPVRGLGVFCSVCKRCADNRYNYCPNCGAKMDLEVST